MTVLVFGATGWQGGAVVDALLAKGAPVRGVTRNTASEAAQRLAGNGIEMVAGDLDDPVSLAEAFRDVSAVYSMQDFYAPGVGLAGKIRQARNVFAAARESGAFVVQSAMARVSDADMPRHFLSKAIIARELERSDISHAILGTVWFMENLLVPSRAPKLHFPVHAGMLEDDTPFHMLSVRDLGEVAAQALTSPREWNGRYVDLAGDILTVPGMTAAYTAATGENPKGWRFPRSIFRRVAHEYADQLDWHRRAGFVHDTAPLEVLLNRKPISFSSFVQGRGLQGL